jgi:hypothetical protein
MYVSILTHSALQIELPLGRFIGPPESGGDGLRSATPELEFAGQLAEEILGHASLLTEETFGVSE